MFKSKKVFDFEIAKTAIRKYCSFQERCQSEVKIRLAQMGLTSDVLDNILSDLILEGILVPMQEENLILKNGDE